MFPPRWRFSWDRCTEVDLFTDRHTLSQAISAAAAEEPDADGSVLFGQLKGTVVGLKYYTGVVSINLNPLAHQFQIGDKRKKYHTLSQSYNHVCFDLWTGEQGGDGGFSSRATESV